jgi:glycosyltransferase involved in cell wall biosynthesis
LTTILHICDWYRPIGGAERLLADTLDLLERNGHTNVVVYNDHVDQIPTKQRSEIPIPHLESFSYHRPSLYFYRQTPIRALEKVIRSYEPDVCHVHNLQNPFVAEYLVRSIPYVRAVHDPRLYCFTHWRLLPDNSVCPYPMGQNCIAQGCLSRGIIPKTFYDKNAKWVLRNFKAHKDVPILIGESRSAIERLTENGFLPEQIAWLPNFTFVKSEAETRSFLDKHFRPDDKIVLFVGRASDEKGIHVLIEACEHLTSECRVVIITAGPLLDEIKRQASHFPDRITVIPGLSYEETRFWYARATVVVVPSVWLETFSLVGLEAYANMKPVIGSRIGGIRDWLKDGETGWFVEPSDPVDLAEKIDIAMSDPERTREMGYAGYGRAVAFYSPELHLKRLLAVYNRAQERFRTTA